jgi:ABC-type uncharacterized transport system ATPase subunit
MQNDNFYSLLKQCVSNPDTHVMDSMVKSFYMRMAQVHTANQARDLYEFVKRVPSTLTKMKISEKSNIKLNGLLLEDSKITIVIGVDENGAPVLVKILSHEKATLDQLSILNNELQAINILGLDRLLDKDLRLVPTKQEKIVVDTPTSGAYACIFMPFYPSSLDNFPDCFHKKLY